MKPQAKAPGTGARATTIAKVTKHQAGCGAVGHTGACNVGGK